MARVGKPVRVVGTGNRRIDGKLGEVVGCCSWSSARLDVEVAGRIYEIHQCFLREPGEAGFEESAQGRNP